MLKVAKFGGSSLSNKTQFTKVKNIIDSDATRKIVVVSAIGKRSNDDAKITDLLYLLGAHLKYNVNHLDIFNMIKKRFIDVKEELNIDYDIENEFEMLKNELNANIDEDYLVSRGEYYTALLMSKYLGYKFIDAKKLIKFSYDGKIDFVETNKSIKDIIKEDSNVVIPGFYGSYPNEQIKLLSRGGSDVTAAIIAGALDASLYENFTDVSGILMADPRIVDNPKAIREISYQELRELSYMGANVLHEETIFPIQDKNIPINIKNTNAPNDEGTLIVKDCKLRNTITGIAGTKDFMSITIQKHKMDNEVGFIAKTLNIFAKYNVNIEHVPSAIDSIDIIVKESAVHNQLYDIVGELKEKLSPDNISIEKEIALIAIVGRNMAGSIGLSAKLFTVLANCNVNVKLIAQSTRELNTIIGVKNIDYHNAVKSIYNGIVGE